MKTGFKKIAAFLTAAAIAATLSGCSDNGYIMEVDGMPIRTGVYISLQQISMSNAHDKLSEITDEDFSDNKTFFAQSINGESMSDWVKKDTVKGIKRFTGVQRLCERYGIVLTDDEKAKINKDIQAEWDSTSVNYYGYTFTIKEMYGYDSMADYYSAQGIGIDSLKEIAYVNALNEKLFLYFYGEGGEDAVPEQEIDDYLEESSVAYRLITIQYVDFRGDPVIGTEQDVMKEFANELADKYNNGAEYVDIMYEYDLYKAQNDAKYKAEQEFDENPPDGVTYDEYIEAAASEATATRYEDDSLFDEIVFNKNEYLSDEVMDFLLEAPADGTAAAYEGVTAAYVIIRNPVSNFPGWKLEHRNEVLTELRGDEYNSKMEILCQNYDVVQKDKLVDGKYAPEKLNK